MLLSGFLLFGRRRRFDRAARHGRRAAAPVVALLVAALCTALPGPAWAGSEEEAARQLDFARTELANEQPDRALKSAESALRLCPTCYDAMVVKALAYEQLGELRLAESLLLAYVELKGEAAASAEARGHIERLQAVTNQQQRRLGEAPSSATSTMEVTVSPVAGLDLDPYRDRVRMALDKGQCQVARSAASELTLAAPTQAEGWRLSGDAARCSGDMREAVRAYRRYVDRDGAEASVLEMIDALAANLATVRVRLELAEGSTVPVVGLDTGQEYLAPFATSDVELLFGDLPVATPMVISLTGRGLQAEYREIEAMGPGEELVVDLAPVWIGLGRVRVSEHEPALCRTTLVTSDDSVGVDPGQEVTITAGEFTARVENDNGALEVPLEVPRDGSVDFAPERHLPASLTVVDLPAGAEVRVFVETPDGEMVEQTTNLSSDGGEIDETTGVRLAPPQKFLSLRGGSGGVFVSHPALGKAPASLVLENGKVNAWTYPWRSLEGVPRVQVAYEGWQAKVALARRGQQRTGALAVVSAVLAGAGAALLVGSAVQDGVLAGSRSDGLAATEGGTNEGVLEAAWQSNLAAQQARTGLMIGGSIGLGLGGAGLVVTIVSGGSAKKAMAGVGAWDPEGVQ